MALGPHPEFSWSVSRYKAFEYCRRQYWFSYYGHWKGWEDHAPDRTKQVYRLKQLHSIASWAGSSVHRGVAEMAGRERTLEQTIEAIHRRMRDEFRASRARVFQQPGRSKSFGLDVHEYGEAVPDVRWKTNWEKVEASLRAFAELPYLGLYREARADGRYHYAEDPDSRDFDAKRFRWDEVGAFPIYAIPDLAYERPDGVIEILDWKTGKELDGDPRDDQRLQLVLYGRLLQDRVPRRPAVHRIRASLVFLPSGQRVGRTLSREDLDWAARTIAGSVEEMQGLLEDAERNVAREERFALTEATQKCGKCVFRGACPRGEELDR